MKNRNFVLIMCAYIFLISGIMGTFALTNNKAMAEENVTQSFEDLAVPANWNSANGQLSVADKRFKLGTKSLIWKIGKDDSVKVSNEKFMIDSASGRNIKSSGFVMWVYSEKSDENGKLSFALGDQTQLDAGEPLTFSFDFHMNFTGWRALWVRLGDDSLYSDTNFQKHLKNTLKLDTMVITASESLDGNSIYFDALEFRKNIFWNRASDYQLRSEKRVDDGAEAISNWSGAYLYSLRTPSIPMREMTAADVDNFKTIEKRLDDWIFGTDIFADKYYNPRPSALSGMVKSAKAKYNSLNISFKNGVWTGNPLFCADSPFVSQGDKFTRGTAENIFLPLALDYKMNNNVDSLNTLMNLYDYWNDQGWAFGSGIGSLDHETLRASGYFASVYVVRNELKETNRLARESKTLEWFCEFGKVYPNSSGIYEQTTADEMRTHFLNRLIKVLIMDNDSSKVQAMESYLEWINGSLKINPNRGDTIKPDFTGFHHNNVYMNAYPPHGYHMASMISYILRDTKFAVAKESRFNLKQALITHDVMTVTATVPFQVRGRFPVQNSDIGKEILPSYAYLALSGDPVTGDRLDLEMAQIFMKKWQQIGLSGQKEVKGYNIFGISYIHSYGALDAIFEVLDKEILAAKTHEGFWNMPYAGMAIKRQDEWLVSVKGFSKYMWDFESGTNENMFGRYSSYGMINVLSSGTMRDGVNYIDDFSNGYDYNNGWDWNRFAGTTSINLPLEKLSAKNGNHRNYSDTSFLGSTGINGEGVFGMDLHDKTFNNTFRAKKSVFMLDDEIIVLGSDIINNDALNKTETTLFQNAIYDKNLPVVLSGNKISEFPYESQSESSASCWLIDPYNNGYFLPDATGLNISRKNQTSLKADGKTASSGNYATAWIDHGLAPSGAGYEYAMLINTTPEKMENYSKRKPYSVLKKDNSAHIISKESSGIFSYVIFDPSAKLPTNGIIESTDTPILALCKTDNKKTTISVSDPDLRIGTENDPVMQNSIMKKTRLTLSGKLVLASKSSDVRVVKSSENSTTLELDCIDGKSIEFVVEGYEKPSHKLTISGISDEFKYSEGDMVIVESPVVNGKTFSHWQASGITLTEEELSNSKITFTMPNNDVVLTAHYLDVTIPPPLTPPPPAPNNTPVIIFISLSVFGVIVIGIALIILRPVKKRGKLK